MHRFCLAAFAAFFLAHCSSDTPKQNKVVEIPTVSRAPTDMSAPGRPGVNGSAAPTSSSSFKPEDTSEGSLFREAKRLYFVGLYSGARENFELLRNTYPVGAYTEYAEIKIADTYFELDDFASAAKLYDDFLKNYPASRALAYIMMKGARSYQLANKGVGRDVGPLEKSLELYNKLIEKYPASIYASAARKYRKEVLDNITEYETMVMEFYEKNENEKALAQRKAMFDQKWGPLIKSAAAEQAPEPASAEKLQLVSLQQSAAVSAEPAQPIIAQGFTTPDPAPPAFESDALSQQETASTQYRIQGFKCLEKDDADLLMLFVDRSFTSPDLSQIIASLRSTDEEKILLIPHATGKAIQHSCFDDEDLRISPNGEIRLRTEEGIEIFTLENPARLVLALG